MLTDAGVIGILSYFFYPEVQKAWHMLILSPT